MKLLLLVLVLGYAHRAHGASTPLNESLIRGGVEVDIKVHPSMAKLSIIAPAGIKDCSGTIISVDWILTAANCIENVLNINIIVGHTNILGVKASYTSTDHKSHPSYVPGSPDYNIGLVRPNTKIKLGPYVTIARLTDANGGVGSLNVVIVPGWGRWTSISMTTSDTLREVRLPVISTPACRQAYHLTNARVSPRNFCAGSRFDGKGACSGDGGSPALVENVQVGIVSYGIGCGVAKYPVIFTDVASLRGWITTEANV